MRVSRYTCPRIISPAGRRRWRGGRGGGDSAPTPRGRGTGACPRATPGSAHREAECMNKPPPPFTCGNPVLYNEAKGARLLGERERMLYQLMNKDTVVATYEEHKRLDDSGRDWRLSKFSQTKCMKRLPRVSAPLWRIMMRNRPFCETGDDL